MDEQRRLLDELMGKTRNEEPEKNKGRHFSDDDVDKFFLAGFSPFLEFRNTKSGMWLNDCYRLAFPDRPRLRSQEWDTWSRNEGLKAQYDALSKEERAKYGYDYDLMMFLEELVAKCDQRIKAVQEDIRTQNEKILTGMSPSDELALTNVNIEIDELNKEVTETEKLAEKGANFDKLQSLMTRLELKRKEKAEILRRVELWRIESQRSVCEISGNVILPPGVKHQNIHDHEAGKQFQGWKSARLLLKELRAQELKPPKARQGSKRSASRERKRGKERSKSRSRALSKGAKSRSGSRKPREKDAEKDRDRRARSRDRDRERRSRDRDRERRSRSRNRDREREKEKDREKDRSRGREKDRSRDRRK